MAGLDPAIHAFNAAQQHATLAATTPRADNNPMDVLTAPLTLTVNGEPLLLEGATTVAALLAHLKLDTRKVAVELNREIVPRSTYATTPLKSGDTLEIVHFIGGG
jgi:thiamine biosynthesis protein ThiS